MVHVLQVEVAEVDLNLVLALTRDHHSDGNSGKGYKSDSGSSKSYKSSSDHDSYDGSSRTYGS